MRCMHCASAVRLLLQNCRFPSHLAVLFNALQDGGNALMGFAIATPPTSGEACIPFCVSLVAFGGGVC